MGMVVQPSQQQWPQPQWPQQQPCLSFPPRRRWPAPATALGGWTSMQGVIGWLLFGWLLLCIQLFGLTDLTDLDAWSEGENAVVNQQLRLTETQRDAETCQNMWLLAVHPAASPGWWWWWRSRAAASPGGGCCRFTQVGGGRCLPPTVAPAAATAPPALRPLRRWRLLPLPAAPS